MVTGSAPQSSISPVAHPSIIAFSIFFIVQYKKRSSTFLSEAKSFTIHKSSGIPACRIKLTSATYLPTSGTPDPPIICYLSFFTLCLLSTAPVKLQPPLRKLHIVVISSFVSKLTPSTAKLTNDVDLTCFVTKSAAFMMSAVKLEHSLFDCGRAEIMTMGDTPGGGF